jgi:hypothetical protein
VSLSLNQIQGDSGGKKSIFCDVIVLVIVGKKFNELFSLQCIIYRVIQKEKSIFYDVIVAVIVRKKFNKLFSSQCITYSVIQEKKSIFLEVIVPIPKISLTITNIENFFHNDP